MRRPGLWVQGGVRMRPGAPGLPSVFSLAHVCAGVLSLLRTPAKAGVGAMRPEFEEKSMKRSVLPLLSASLCAALAFLFALPAAAKPSFSQAKIDGWDTGEAVTTFDVLSPPEVQVNVSNGTFAWIRWEQDETSVDIPMTASGNTWFGRLPVNHAGSAKFWFYAVDETGVENSTGPFDITLTENTTTEPGLTNQRFPNINSWTITTANQNNGANLDTAWYGAAMVAGDFKQFAILKGAASTNSSAGGTIRTRQQLPAIGSIWFKARSTRASETAGTLVVEKGITTGTGRWAVTDFTPYKTFSVPYSTVNWTQYHLVLQDFEPTDQLRFRNTSPSTSADDTNNNRIELMDIVITPLIPDVVIHKDELDYRPGYPSVQDPIDFHLAVSNRFDAAPAANITPRLVWRQKSGTKWGGWNETVLTNTLGRAHGGEPGLYACTLTTHKAGDFEYYYEVGFTGYTPTFPAVVYPTEDGRLTMLNNVSNTNDWRYLADFSRSSEDTICECRSPARWPNFAEEFRMTQGADYYRWSHPADAARVGEWDLSPFFDVQNLYQGYFPRALKSDDYIATPMQYLSFLAEDGVRRFRSHYTHMTVLPKRFDESAPAFDIEAAAQPGLQPEYPMTLVGDDVWQAIIHQTSAVDANLAVTGGLRYVEGATAYVRGGAEEAPFFWLQVNQDATAINPPMSGKRDDDLGDSSLRVFGATPWTKTVTHVVEKSQSYERPDEWLDSALVTGVSTNGTDALYWTALGEIATFDGTVETNWTELAWNWVEDPTVAWKTSAVTYATAMAGLPEGTELVQITNTVANFPIGSRSGTWQWTETVTEDETHFTPDLSDLGEGDVAGTRMQIDYDGFLMFRFNTETGEYQIRRAAWQDFNDWTADDSYFSRSVGLYDQAVFTSDAEGLAKTRFGEATTVRFARAIGDPGELQRAPRYLDGTVAVNTWDVQDTRAGEGEGLSATGNHALRLNAFSSAPGSVETTDIRSFSNLKEAGGRGVLTFRARSSSADRTGLVYAPGLWWDNNNDGLYAVAWFREVSDVSDAADPHFSTMVAWHDARNWAEARLVQKVHTVRSSSVDSASGLVTRYPYLRLELWQCVDGVESQLGSSVYQIPTAHNGKTDTDAMNLLPRGGDYSLAKNGGWLVGVALKGVQLSAYVYDAKDFATASATSPVRPWCRNNNNSSAQGTTALAAATASIDSSLVDRDDWINFSTGNMLLGTVGVNLRDVVATASLYVFNHDVFTDETAIGNQQVKGCLWPDASAASGYGAVCTDATASHWRQTSGSETDWIKPWYRLGGSGGGTVKTNPTKWRRQAPKVHFRVETCRTGQEDSPDVIAPVPGNGEDWDSEWDEILGHTSDGVRSVSSYAWQTVSIPMHLWDDTFVRIVALPDNGEEKTLANGADNPAWAQSEGSLVVDDIGSTDWLGKTVLDPDYGDDRWEENSWVATYAAVTGDPNDIFGQVYELARSRANPNARSTPDSGETLPKAYTNHMAQSITSPLLKNGVGDISFTYQATNGLVKFAIEMVDERTGAVTGRGLFGPVDDEEEDDNVFVANPADGPQPLYKFVARANVRGRLRIRTLGEKDGGYGPAGTLYVDNLRVTDYPNTSDSSWEAYNALVSTMTGSGGRNAPSVSKQTDDKFDTAVDRYRSAILNNSSVKEVYLGDTLDAHLPYLQTPAIETGVGEVSFWYRRAPGEKIPGLIELRVAKNSGVPDEQWIALTPDDLNPNRIERADGTYELENPNLEAEIAAMGALTNITTDTWTYFSAEFYQKDNYLLRIYSGTNWVDYGTTTGTARVMLDNVLITEPVRSSVDVGKIEFDPGVPLCTGSTGAKVTLVNPRMNPHNIRVRLDWFAIADTPSTPFVPVSVTNTFTVVTTNRNVWIEERDGATATWVKLEPATNVYDQVHTTRLPGSYAAFGRTWGYDSWRGVANGSLSFTNAPGQPYVFYSENRIPTDEYPADTVFQYCVCVEYEGSFAQPIYSESQGRMRNAFWFENPDWYKPIDLNEAYGTTNRPVAHFWNFTVSTNQAFVNEIQPALRSSAYDEYQFVEIMGAEGGSLAGWTLWHHGYTNGIEEAGYIWTNTMPAGAVFKADPNATTNKGWGFWVLGNSRIENRDQELFPAGWSGSPHNLYLYSPGAITLRRSMGAYVDRLAWGTESETADMVAKNGFDYIGYRATTLNMSFIRTFELDEDTGARTAMWLPSNLKTIGGYNPDEENGIWDISGAEVEEPEPPLVDKPVITALDMVPATGGDTRVTVTFEVALTNAVDLTASDFAWYLDRSDDVSFESFRAIPMEGVEIQAAAQGAVTNTFTYTEDVGASQPVRFYRIRAVPVKKWEPWYE